MTYENREYITKKFSEHPKTSARNFRGGKRRAFISFLTFRRSVNITRGRIARTSSSWQDEIPRKKGVSWRLETRSGEKGGKYRRPTKIQQWHAVPTACTCHLFPLSFPLLPFLLPSLFPSFSFSAFLFRLVLDIVRLRSVGHRPKWKSKCLPRNLCFAS